MPDLDPRLVDLYDADNPSGADHAFYRDLADRSEARRILDLGCGTGQLTVTFCRDDREIFGIDPSSAMLDRARSRPGGAGVHWVHGDISAMPGAGLDLAVMSGNVPEHIADGDWELTLRDLRSGLLPGGMLAFETRNPGIREWESWQNEDRTIRETLHGPLEEWAECFDRGDGLVAVTFHNRFLRTDEVLSVREEFSFRDEASLRRQLHDASFEVEAIVGSWAGAPVDERSANFVVTARAT